MTKKSKALIAFLRKYDPSAMSAGGDEIAVPCFVHKGGKDMRKKLYVNTVKGLWICYYCGQKGNVRGLVRRLREKYPQRFKGVNLDALEVDERVVVEEPEVKEFEARLPEEFQPLHPISRITSAVGKRALLYLKNRGIGEDLIEMYGLGYCEFGLYSHRIIIPTYEAGVLVYWLGRDITGTAFKKVVNPPKSLVGSGSKAWLFGFNLASAFEEAVICEGVFDAMSVRLPLGPIGSGIALFGKTMSDAQRQKILSADFRTLTISLDADARKDVLTLAKTLADPFVVRNPPRLRVALFPEGDPNSMRDRLSEVRIEEISDPDMPFRVGSVM